MMSAEEAESNKEIVNQADKGRLTTITSNMALAITTMYVAQQISPDLLVQVVIGATGIGLAILDSFYPEIIDKLNASLVKQGIGGA